MISRRMRSTRVHGLCGFKILLMVPLAFRWFSFARVPSSRLPTVPGLPETRARGHAQSRAAFIDQLLESAWKKAGVTPTRLATDEEYLRRAYLDLLGRIPGVQEARAFLQTKETDKREKLVDFLLEHPDYPKNFGTQWTILLIGRGNQGRMVDRGSLASWLRKQFAANRPWNDIVYDLVTASGSNKENGAVNYTLGPPRV